MKTFSSRPARIAALVLRMALGLLFIVSAILKLVGIDEFEAECCFPIRPVGDNSRVVGGYRTVGQHLE